MKSRLNIALAGAGLVGKRHIEAIRKCSDDLRLVAIVDPDIEIKRFSIQLGVDWFSRLSDLFSKADIDGIILATPNLVHVANGLEAVDAKCPMLVEKPIAANSNEAAKLVEAAKVNNVPLLVGHHRRHNPQVKHAKEIVESGQLGKLVSVQSTCWFLKPDEYYAPDWRRQPGAGPVLVNAIHDVDLQRYFCGEVVQVFAQASNRIRNLEIEDTLSGILEFESGTHGTVSVTDSVASPWSWELTSGENPAFPYTTESSIRLGGTKGALSIPNNRIWSHDEDGHWTTAISAKSDPVSFADPLVMQLIHFAEVIRGNEKPLVSGEEGLASLKVIESLLLSAKEHKPVKL